MKLTYWYSECPDDSDVYSIRTKTKKEALRQINAMLNPASWPSPRKVTVEYDGAFDLLLQCSQEGHHYWEV